MAQTWIRWTGPTQRVDGTPLSQEEQDAMVYDLGYQPLGQADRVYTVVASLPGTLNPEGRYEIRIADVALPEEDVDIALRATDREGRASAWSNEAQVYKAAGPNPPTALAVEE